MADYKQYGRSGGPQKRSFTKSAGSFQKELYNAECNNCGQRCQVPFRPNGKKPVYCSNCFTKNEGQGAPRSDTGRRDYEPRATAPAALPDRQIQELNTQIKIMNETLQKLVVAVDTFNRATALTNEIRKHFPAEGTPPAEKVKAVAKKTIKPAAAPKKSTKK